MNIAVWSGPRNLSTAMMYSFGARSDCAVWDEPFYAAYLAETGLDHPMRAEVIAAGEVDPDVVAQQCARTRASGKPLFYQKHMAHHITPNMPRDWFDEVAHVFLIRHPSRVLASYAQKRENPTLEDIGFRQQAEIFETLGRRGIQAVVVDSFDIRQNPEKALRLLCERIGIDFDPAMMKWPAGGHRDDGAWAPHWYNAVHKSTGFAGQEGDIPVLPSHFAGIRDAAMPYYETLRENAIDP